MRILFVIKLGLSAAGWAGVGDSYWGVDIMGNTLPLCFPFHTVRSAHRWASRVMQCDLGFSTLRHSWARTLSVCLKLWGRRRSAKPAGM